MGECEDQKDVFTETEQIPEDLNSAIQLYDKIMAHEVSVDTVCSEIILETVQQSSSGIGNWDLHLKSLQEMLPYFAAAGHNLLYTKSVHMYRVSKKYLYHFDF